MKRLIASAVVVSLTALFCVPASASQFLNISTRADVFPGDGVLIGGCILSETRPRRVIIRGIGPTLASIDSAPSGRPILELHKPDGSVVTNDDWRGTQEGAIVTTLVEAYQAD